MTGMPCSKATQPLHGRAWRSGSRASRAKTSPASSTPAEPAARHAGCASTTARSCAISTAAHASFPRISGGARKSSSRSCRSATPTSTPPASTCPSAWAGRSIFPKASTSSPAISRKCVRPSWSSSPCLASGAAAPRRFASAPAGQGRGHWKTASGLSRLSEPSNWIVWSSSAETARSIDFVWVTRASTAPMSSAPPAALFRSSI